MAPVKHPLPFEDLVALAKPTSYDPQRSFKDQLRAIDILRSQSAESKKENDLANAYVYLARAAAVINDFLPRHSQYDMLTEKQKLDLSNNGRIMVRTLDELEPTLREQYRQYQIGVENGSIAPPKRRKTDEERKEKEKRKETVQDKSSNVTLPRTPTSIEEHSSTTRSTKPTPGVTVMLSEAQQREQDRHRQLERDRAARERGFISSDDDRSRRSNRSQGSAPAPETAMPTPVPTPDRRETSTLSFTQLPHPAAASSSILERRRAEAEADRPRKQSRIPDDDVKRAMGRLQEQFDAQLQSILNDPRPVDETERLQRALDVVAEIGQAERDWIEEKNRLALQERRPSTFDNDLGEQSNLQEARMKQVRNLIKERTDRFYKQQADARAQAEAESRAREARLREEERETQRRKAEYDATARERSLNDARERQRAEQQRARDDLLRAERERTRGSDGERERERDRDRDREAFDPAMRATQDAMARVSLAAQQRAEIERNPGARRPEPPRQVDSVPIIPMQPARSMYDPPMNIGPDPSPRPPPTSQIPRSPNAQPFDFSHPLLSQYFPISPGPPAPSHPQPIPNDSRSRSPIPAALRPNVPSASPRPSNIPRVDNMYTNPNSSAAPIPIPIPIPIPQQRPHPYHVPASHSPVSFRSSSLPSNQIPTPARISMEQDRERRDSDRDSIPSLRSRPSYIHSNNRSATLPQEKLAAIEALPIESPTRSIHSSLEERRDFSSMSMASPTPGNEVLPAGTSPNYTSFMSHYQRSQGYVPPGTFSSPESSHDGTPDGLLFQPNGVTSVPAPVDRNGGSKRQGSLSRSSLDPPSGPSLPYSVPYSAGHNGMPPKLKTIRLPADTTQRFVSLASINTAKKKETLGMLYGRLNVAGTYDITTLLVPKQTSTEHTCVMTHEELVAEFAQARDVIQLGWIHTHPTQSCFMSSMDLHTHAMYQKDLPESIAIVCSPRHKPYFGIFRLTERPGLPLILGCDNQASFHPHTDSEPIYTDADSDHVKLMKDILIEIVDLR